MTMWRIAGVFGILISAAAPVGAFADQAPTAVSPAATTAKGTLDPRLDPSTIVCKSEDLTGSRLGGKKVCLTRQQWADMSRASRDRLEDTQRSSRSN